MKCSAGLKLVKEDLDSIKTLVLLELLFVWFSLKFTLSFKRFVHKNKGIEVLSKTRKDILFAFREEKHLYWEMSKSSMYFKQYGGILAGSVYWKGHNPKNILIALYFE